MNILSNLFVWTGIVLGTSLMFVTNLHPAETVLGPAQTFSALPPVAYEPDVPTLALERFQRAYRGAECSEVTVAIVVGLRYDEGVYGKVGSAGPGNPCVLTLDWESAVDKGWRGQYVVQHEVAHLETLSEPVAHGPVFEEHLFGLTHGADTGRVL